MDPSPSCEYCKKSSKVLEICTNCEKVWYCRDSHKKRHLSQHESDCFPAFVQSNDDCGRFWIATRDIRKGELIFSEKALIIGPNTECTLSSPLLTLAYPTCLGCCRGTNTVYTCSKCHWPVCSKRCEKISQHANYECKVFKKNKILASTRPQYYLYIQFLRALLLSEVKPAKFKKVMNLEPHIEDRKSHEEENQITTSFYKFLTEDCNLQYDFDIVDHVVGVNRINSYSADIVNTSSKKRSCTALFYQLSLLNHDCLPNTRSVIFENPTDLTITMNLFASTDIWKGQCISQQYYPVVKGTLTRRKALKEWFFDCSCDRCADPTEFETHFSCLKCQSCDGEGFICPVDSLDYFSIWECDKCNFCQSSEEQLVLVTEIEQETQKCDQNVENLERVLERILNRKEMHIHHYIAINVQYDITQKIVKALNNVRNVELIRRGVQYCKNILDVVNIICPGFSYYRGVILYFLANCYYALYEMKELDFNNECNLNELIDLIEEGIEIMDVEPNGSIYREMATELQTYKGELNNSL